ncbi:hypothetical protein V7S43_015795 [Phytophthora oleae]|uniref:Chitin-binding type-4 domain-containing protein n=1 Tax=Phytophthora oleae TaxID=2107226 RepID=A0ABD3EY89_9STRA
MVLHGDNCEDEYPGGDVGSTVTSDMPVDYSSCNGDCTLTIYWLAFQNEQWQAYINCVPLTGSGSTTTSAASSSTAAEAETTDVSAMETPVATTQATEAPTTSTEAPSTKTKCNAPSRQLRKETPMA